MDYKPFDEPKKVSELFERVANRMSVCLVFEDGTVFANTKESSVLKPYYDSLVDGAKASAEEWSVKFFMK